MHKVILFLLLILLGSFSVKSQQKLKVIKDNKAYTLFDQSEYKCVYDYKYQTDSLDQHSSKQVYMTLLIGTKYNIFKSEFNFHIDSLLYLSTKGLVSEEQITEGFSQVSPGGPKYTLISKNNTNQVDLIYPTTEGVWEVNENTERNWKLGTLNDTINGYLCKNAFITFKGRKYTAWYTSQIPMAYGPYKFAGLPGLIVKITDQKNTQSFELIGIQKHHFEMVKKNEKTIKMTAQQLKKAIRNYKIGMIEKAKLWFANDPNKIERYSKKILSENNPIELE